MKGTYMIDYLTEEENQLLQQILASRTPEDDQEFVERIREIRDYYRRMEPTPAQYEEMMNIVYTI